MKIVEIPAALRPRERAMREGFEKLSDRELVSLFVRFGTKRFSALEIADKILIQSGGISGLQSVTIKSLMSIHGISKVKALEICAIIEMSNRIIKPNKNEEIVVQHPEKLVSWLNGIIGYETQECFDLICLDVHNCLIEHVSLFKGTLDRSIVHPRDVFREAVKHNAAKVIIAHNHPGGSLVFSRSDIHITEVLVSVGKAIGIYVVDHLLVSHGHFASLNRENPNIFAVDS